MFGSGSILNTDQIPASIPTWKSPCHLNTSNHLKIGKSSPKDIATAFRIISKVEKAHDTRYRKLYDNLESGIVFQREDKVFWKCRVCGFIHESKTPPKICPACNHPQAYFEIMNDNY